MALSISQIKRKKFIFFCFIIEIIINFYALLFFLAHFCTKTTKKNKQQTNQNFIQISSILPLASESQHIWKYHLAMYYVLIGIVGCWESNHRTHSSNSIHKFCIIVDFHVCFSSVFISNFSCVFSKFHQYLFCIVQTLERSVFARMYAGFRESHKNIIGFD